MHQIPQISVIKKYKFFDLEFASLNEAAEYLGVSQAMASFVFSGKKRPTSKMLEKVGMKAVKHNYIVYEKL